MVTSENDETSSSSASEYLPTLVERSRVSAIDIRNGVFMCETSQLQQFIDLINANCSPQCKGKLFPISIKHVGLGGSATACLTTGIPKLQL